MHAYIPGDGGLTQQLALFPSEKTSPQGLRYVAEFISPALERELIGHVSTLPLQPFQFGAFEGKRRVASFGFRYDYTLQRLQPAESIPGWLLPLIEKVEAHGGPSTRIAQILCTEYDVGVGIGWHRDKRPDLRPLAWFAVQVPLSARGWRKMAALHARGRAALALHNVRRIPTHLGTQHPRRRGAAILHHLPYHG